VDGIERLKPATRYRLPSVELAAAGVLLIVYTLTLAPSVTLWDSGEFLAAMHSLGIPHPPGTPLYVLIGKVWSMVLGPVLGFARSVNMLSAVAMACAAGLLANLILRWTRDAAWAFAAAVTAGAMSSVWMSANETEVYAIALLVSVLILWCADRAAITGDSRWLLLGAYIAGLGWALHLTALLSAPAALYLVLSRLTTRQALRRPPLLAMSALLFCLGASVVLFMIVRGQHDPFLNEGNASTWSALSDVLMRREYRPVAPWPRQAPLFLQIGNVFEYADWQIALGLAPDAPPSWLRTPFTILFVLLGIIGCAAHRTADRRSWRAMMILFLTATLAVIAYMNHKASPSFGIGILPPHAPHEARERDYFYILAFVCWGLWCGIGGITLSRRIAPSRSWARNAGVLVPIVPLVLNWAAVDRSREPVASEARRAAANTLLPAPRHAVVLARGDNDAFPAWYAQEVERIRRDVTVVVVPMLPADWYREEIRRRYGILGQSEVQRWEGFDQTLASLRKEAGAKGRAVVEVKR
jgi:hypothetical protein